MAALTAVTVTCPACREPITVPVVLTETRDPDGRRRGAFEPVTVKVRVQRTAVGEHACTDDRTPRSAAA